ncbi:D-aspartate oxidase [Nostocoides japonicum T1-X7]|uniref:D-amino-acid oxidase n=1 Tax=Nostocoides japonicum T1-X7 TaxID=1194083 RepID=A0A077LTT4_9MICO|nr:FAD-dependent oxidoreductase [Tetrasphaera japonica]CCH77058.1 D-aspartate oxidase [Tetrasphaera japonica T1-X7]
MARVTVVGGGVVGLTTALELAEAGHRVTVVRDQPVEDTVSRVAGGLWFPYHVEPRARAVAWGLVALRRFTALAHSPDGPAAGVRMAHGVMVHRTEPDLWWTEGLGAVLPAPREVLPTDALGGYAVRVPLVDTGAFLPWLENRCATTGVRLVRRTIDSLDDIGDDLEGDVVVIAAGLRSATLLPDPEVRPGRGQVVRLANPGLTEWVVDPENPAGLAYVLPHGEVVVCGGTDVEGEWSTEPDPEVERAILARCRDLVPALRDAPVVGRAVGLRPLAPSVRLARHTVDGRDIVTNYGHGGAGVTLSWGCAEEVVRLLA